MNAAEFITKIEFLYPFPWIYRISNHCGFMSFAKPNFCEIHLHTYRNGLRIEKFASSQNGWQALFEEIQDAKPFGPGLKELEDAPTYFWPKAPEAK